MENNLVKKLERDLAFRVDVKVDDYVKAAEEIKDFNKLLKDVCRAFHKYGVPLTRISAICEVVRQYLTAEYAGYGNAFEMPKADKK